MRYFIALVFLVSIFLFAYPTPVHAVYLNKRLGVTNSCGNYPTNRISQGNYPQFQAQKSIELGFQGIELILVPRSLCSTSASNPKGCYFQSDQYCTNGELNAENMQQMFVLPQFAAVMDRPLSTITLFVEAVKKTSMQQDSIHVKTTPYTQSEIDSTYTEVREAVEYLLNQYRDSGKTFLIAPVNELDNRMVQNTGCLATGNHNACNDVTVSPIVVANSITFLQTYARAIRDAKAAVPPNGVKIYLTCEVNMVLRRSMRSKTSAARDVIPESQCDIVSYSAYETHRDVTLAYQARQNMTNALNYLAGKTPDHPDFPGGKNVMIGETGQGENSNNYPYNSATAAISAAMKWGVYRFNIWTLFDQSCSVANPRNSDCKGFWMIRPDGSKSQMYKYLLTTYSTTPVLSSSISATNLNTGGILNLLDYIKAGLNTAYNLLN